MVWGLFSADPTSGEKYYIYAKGTYKVGRKGCDVIINSDKSVSRIHAEIIVDTMVSLEPIENRSTRFSTKVRIRDCSKYGTFIERNSEKREKIADCPGKETYLNDGDLIFFGTGSVAYRFSYVPFTFYLCTSSRGTQDKVSSIGASFAHTWTMDCTHAIADPFMPLSEDIIDVILSKKPLVLSTWLEHVVATRINNELPSYSQYFPTLALDGGSVVVADSRVRENCSKGYIFVLDSVNMYRFKERVQLLLEVAGAKVLSLEDIDLNIEEQEQAPNTMVLVVPTDSSGRVHHGSSLPKVNEISLISSVISGNLDPSIFVSPTIVVSSSCSTDETVVADSDVETETATSNHPATINQVVNQEINHDKDLNADLNLDSKMKTEREGTEYKSKVEKYVQQDASLGDGEVASFLEPSRVRNLEKNDNLENPNQGVLYSQKLVVKGTSPRHATGSVTEDGVINFKRFKKTKTQSGNSFSNLVPFSKYPYTDSDYDKEVSEYVNEEKKRKKIEAIAEDLFNNDRGQRRRVGGSLHGLLSH